MSTITAQAKNTRSLDALPKDYRSLCMDYLPRPIHSKRDLKEAYRAIEPMVGREDDMTEDQSDYLAIITDSIIDFEDEPAPEVAPDEMLRFLMDQRGLRPIDLARILGVDRSQAGRLVNGQSNLTVPHIKILSKEFGASPALFIG